MVEVLKNFYQVVGVRERLEKLKFKIHVVLLKNMQIWESLEKNGLMCRNKPFKIKIFWEVRNLYTGITLCNYISSAR